MALYIKISMINSFKLVIMHDKMLVDQDRSGMVQGSHCAQFPCGVLEPNIFPPIPPIQLIIFATCHNSNSARP